MAFQGRRMRISVSYGRPWKAVLRVCRQSLVLCLTAALLAVSACAEDWPTYRHDAARSGITSEQIRTPLVESWVFRTRHAPQPAWGAPKVGPVEDILELRRNHFDDAFQPIVAGGRVFFGSSADNKVYCLDLASGEICWTQITGGPVRLAPTFVAAPGADSRRGSLLAGSDDGFVYKYGARDGALLWKFRAAPEDRRVLGSGKMISLWPLRTGVLVDGNTAYFGAGIFPAEGIFLYAFDADRNREIWRNDTCGEPSQSAVSPQGYLLASKSTLYVPMGRVSPTAFDRRDGRLLQQPPFFGKTVGGTYALLAGDDVYTGTEEMIGYHGRSRDRFAKFAGRKMVVADDAAYLAGKSQLMAIGRGKKPATRWKIDCPCHDELILAGDLLLAGGRDQVIAVDALTGKQLWTAKVDGAAKALALADGRLIVSTDKGLIYCFAAEGAPQHGAVSEPINENPFGNSPTADLYRRSAETILKQTGVKRGYCLLLGLETGELALELARRSELMIYAVSSDAGVVAAARKKLDAAGVYGTRVCVEQWPPEKIPYADYFANLIVSETNISKGRLPECPDELFRMLKPLGGTLMLKSASGSSGSQAPQNANMPVQQWLSQSELKQCKVSSVDERRWVSAVRGPLPGAGSWTHQYANPANTTCGDDRIVKCPLGVLWFGAPGPRRMVQRHSRAAGPLAIDGRLFVQGENVVMAYDAYNGVKLWEREIPGAIRVVASHDSSNLALRRDGLFVAVGDKCLRLDPATGQTAATYHLPATADGKPGRWGYVACAGKVLYGTRTQNMRQSDCLFATDIASGETRWVYQGKGIPHNSIAIDGGRLFLLSGHATPEQHKAAVEDARRRIQELPEHQRAKAEKVLGSADVRMVVALDAATGKPLWEKPAEVNRASGKSKSGSMTQATMVNNGVLVLFGVYLDGHYWQQFFAGEFDTRRITALSANDGELLWSKLIPYRVRPLIVGDTLHAEPWAFDLHTGRQKTRVHPITGLDDAWQFARPGHHCGCPAASPNCLFFRSWSLGYYDLQGDYGTMHFGAQRPGCWINFIPAGGLLLVPEASAGCMCAFPNMCSIVFKPTQQNKAWAWYSAPGPITPVKRLAINFGAPGDRRDAAGKLWFGYPRPYKGRLVLPLKLETSFCSGGKFVTQNSVYCPDTGTDDRWLFASAADGLLKCVVPLLGKDDPPALYRVRLAMADPENDQPGQRVFDIKLQGKTVQENFDIAGETGGRNRALLKQFDGVEVRDRLTIELAPRTTGSAPQQRPILQGLEITRQK